MREIKFRAWDKKKKGWKGLWIFRGGHTLQYDVSKEKIDILDLTNQWLDIEFMQYTGLKDKNGKDIYGDSDYLQDDEGLIYMLKWWEERAGWWLWFWDGTDWDWDEGIEDFYNYKTKRILLKIIGSIYENPELLTI